MKTFLTLFLMTSSFILLGQDNRSDGGVIGNFLGATPPQQFSGQEIFRFQPGVVTQLAAGSTAFDFSSSQWFSIGNLDTSLLNPPFQGTNEVFGLRFQLPNKALIYGYQDIGDINPRIQWIGTGEDLGNLEFRVADSFFSANSTLVARMTPDARFILPQQPLFPSIITGISDSRLQVLNNTFTNGINVVTAGNATGDGYAIRARSQDNANNFGVGGFVTSPGSIGSFSYGIYGNAPSTIGTFAGFFDGAVHINGPFSHTSDKKLKDNLLLSEDVLSKLSQLNSYTYTFKDNDNLNLPKGLQYGFVAQELEELYPELVSEVIHPIYNDKEELIGKETFKSVNYIGLISELTAAINELNAKVKDLEGQLETKVVYKSNFSSQELDKINKNSYQLQQNTPNPFSESTIISYVLPENQNDASILIFDLNGRLVNTYDVNETKGELKINATDLNGAGMYLYTLFANGEEIITKRMILK